MEGVINERELVAWLAGRMRRCGDETAGSLAV